MIKNNIKILNKYYIIMDPANPPKKRGRKPSIKKLINNENTSDSISKINDNFLSESGELEAEIDQITLANMIKIEKNAKKLSLLEFIFKKNGPPSFGDNNFAFQAPVSFDFMLNFWPHSLKIWISVFGEAVPQMLTIVFL